MIRPIDIRLNAAHPELPLAEAVTFTGSPSTVLVRGVPPNCGRWAITAVFVAATYPDGSTTTRAAVQSANGVWVATLPATARSGRTANGLRVMADGIDENGAAVTGYILGVADFAVASLGVTPAPQPGETSWQMLYFDAVPGTLRKGDVAKVDGVLKLYNGTAWEAFAAPLTYDNTVTKDSANGVKSSGIWSAIWGALASLPTGFTSLYDWCVSQLAGKVPTSRKVNGKALSSDVTLTGADIPVDATQGAQKIDAALAGKQSALSAQQLANIAAVPNKANNADVVHQTGDETISGIKRFSGTLYVDDSHGELRIMSRGFLWSMTGGQEPEILFPTKSGTLALTANIPYALVTKTISNGAVSLDDRASNSVTVSATLSPNTLTINFPTAPTGKLRDFAMRLNIAAGVTAPEIAWPQGVTLENDGGEMPEIADGGTGGSSTILYFSESENNGTTAKFTVKGETLTAITQA